MSWLALLAARPHGWVYLIRSINSLAIAGVVLVAALYLVRASVTERLLRPFTTAGTMALTLYSAFVLVLATGMLRNNPAERYLVLLAGALLFALLWRRFLADGPLEWLMAQASGWRRVSDIAAGGRWVRPQHVRTGVPAAVRDDADRLTPSAPPPVWTAPGHREKQQEV